jgi:putative sterol carrier protein
MTDATAEFFQELGRRGHEPLLEKATGAIRFDLTAGPRTEHWTVAVDNGDISVSRKARTADCVVRAEKAVFEELANGELNGLTAYLRGAISLEGNPELMVLVQRVFPSPRGRSAHAAGGRDRR